MDGILLMHNATAASALLTSLHVRSIMSQTRDVVSFDVMSCIDGRMHVQLRTGTNGHARRLRTWPM